MCRRVKYVSWRKSLLKKLNRIVLCRRNVVVTVLLKNKLKRDLQMVVGKRCWSIGRNGIGSNLLIDLGRQVYSLDDVGKVKEKIIVKGENSFTIFCLWRMETATEVLCTWQDCMLEDGEKEKEEFLSACRLIEDSMVTDVVFSLPSCDITLEFSSGVYLKVFCDTSVMGEEESDGVDNYYYSTLDTLYAVQSRSIVVTEALEQCYYEEGE